MAFPPSINDAEGQSHGFNFIRVLSFPACVFLLFLFFFLFFVGMSFPVLVGMLSQSFYLIFGSSKGVINWFLVAGSCTSFKQILGLC